MKQRKKWFVGCFINVSLFIGGPHALAVETPTGKHWDTYVETHQEEFHQQDNQENARISEQEVDFSKTQLSTTKNTRQKNSVTVRYTVVMLDSSGSMSGKPMTIAKAAAKKFAKQMLEANGENHLAVVGFGNGCAIHREAK